LAGSPWSAIALSARKTGAEIASKGRRRANSAVGGVKKLHEIVGTDREKIHTTSSSSSW
jgi:hypothetical protein